MDEHDLFITKSAGKPWQPTRRAGVREKMLLPIERSPHQNVVLVEMHPSAEIELHQVRCSESIFVIEGRYEVVTHKNTETLGPGDLCHFPADSFHGLRCVQGPGRFLVVFAPALDRAK